LAPGARVEPGTVEKKPAEKNRERTISTRHRLSGVKEVRKQHPLLASRTTLAAFPP
jgi:hypothetical protein